MAEWPTEQRIMANPDGSFVWYELMTPDPDAIAPFYGDVIGWTITKADPRNRPAEWITG
jgi:predicted enzyme related to lactoylglutathione lyase